MSANLAVDLGKTCLARPSFPSAAVAADGGIAISSGGVVSSLSGVMIGDIVDLRDADTYCNVWAAGRTLGSGPLLLQVQDSNATTSGSFTDPTSGLTQFPTPFVSGGILVIGSGAWAAAGDVGGIFGSGVSGQNTLSGFFAIAAFQRVGRYARVNMLSGFMDWANCQAGFISQFRTTGSGAGYSYSPGSGTLSV